MLATQVFGSSKTIEEGGMVMDVKFKWASFKDRTNITGRRRGSNMKEVDEALQAYWDEVAGAPTNQKRQMYAAFTLLKACNSWLKLKKDKNTKMSVPGAKQNEHFKTRWDAVKDLAKAAFAETYKLQADPNKPLGVVEYERKKMLAASAPARTTKALSGGYATERAMWLGSKKQANPVSGTTLHETIDALTNTAISSLARIRSSRRAIA